MSRDASRVPFEELASTDLVVDAIYEGGRVGSTADDVLARLLPGAGNQGGFREIRSPAKTAAFVALSTSGENVDWPDALDSETGRFTYFGDNRTPGRALHDTQRGGNELLRRAFDHLHGEPPARSEVPPFLVFKSVDRSRARRFIGLAVPVPQT